MLPAPNLDDRRFQDLVDDAKRLVQQRCPEWTDHNVSDPGITLIETFAMMVDQLIYRLNRVPDRNYIKFLELIGVELRPTGAAQGEVTFWLSAPQPQTITVRARNRGGHRPDRCRRADHLLDHREARHHRPVRSNPDVSQRFPVGPTPLITPTSRAASGSRAFRRCRRRAMRC